MDSEDQAGLLSEVGKYVTAILLGMAVVLLTATPGICADWPQFRGVNRDGKSPDMGLLKEWPPEGPKLLWAVEDLGGGYASVAVVGDTVYTTGMEEDISAPGTS